MQLRFKSSVFLAGLMMLSAGLSHSASAQNRTAQNRSAQSVPGELLVRWKSQRAPLVLSPGTSPARWQQSGLASQLSAKLPGSRLQKVFAASGWSLVKVPAGQTTEAARAALAKTLGAANVSLNFRRHVSRVPNDPSYSSQWQWPKVSAPDAWNLGTGTRDVVVAVLDTGIDLNHADLQANLWTNTKEIAGNGLDDDGNGYIDDIHGLNGIDPSSPPQESPNDGHGTHVAGLIGAVGNNGQSVTGACWSVKIMALKFIDFATGVGDDDDGISCIEYAIKMKQSGVNLRVINNSYDGSFDNPAFKEAYQAAERAGILNVCAAGNAGEDNDVSPVYPAAYSSPTNITVAATNQSDSLAYFSSYGAQTVDLGAPGDGILSLKLGGGTTVMSGTSMASPIVAGAAALISSLEPNLSASQLKARLMSTVDPVSALSGKTVSGGRLNMARAVNPIPYEVRGQVYRLNGTSRAPLATAKVVLSGKISASTTTDNSGNYSFGNLPPGTYSLAVTLKGYTFTTVTRAIPDASGGTTQTVDFQATSVPTTFYTLFGVAKTDAGVPVAGVSIALNAVPTTILATTGSDGKYSIPNRPQGTYTLKATGGNYKWSATPGSIAVPDSAKNGQAEVNFKGVLIDKVAPAVTITTPASGATFAPGNQLATGTSVDATGNANIYLELERSINFVRSYYNWTTRVWDANRSSATTLTRTTSGKKTNWSATLPGMAPASYSLRVWGRDSLGNVSRGEADAFSSFNVVKPGSSGGAS